MSLLQNRWVVGGAAPASSGAFASGNGSTDPVQPGTAWNTASYPAQGTANRTAGVKFAVNTTGYTNLSVSWDTQNSASANRYARLQYTTDGTTFIDYAGKTNT